jgi:hypothetical protein
VGKKQVVVVLESSIGMDSTVKAKGHPGSMELEVGSFDNSA